MKHDLKVFKDMDEHLEAAMAPTEAGGRLDLSIWFYEDQSGQKAAVAMREPSTGRTLCRLPMDSPQGLNMSLARLVFVAFRQARRSRTRPLGAPRGTSATQD